jgi:hypothetical protein
MPFASHRAVGSLDPFQGFPDRLRLPRQVEDQCLATDHPDLTREDGGRYEAQADAPHFFTEARHHLVGDRQGGFGRDVALRGAGATGGQHQVAADPIDQLDQRGFDGRLVVGNQAGFHSPGTAQARRANHSRRAGMPWSS